MNKPNQEALISLPPGVSADQLGEIEAAALVSGGIESAVMLGVLGAKLKRLYPIYMEFGLCWEKLEQRQLSLYLQALDCKQVQPLTVLSMPMQDVYKKHWGIDGSDVPMSGTPDEAVYIPGRNLLMVAKASVWCTLNQIKLIALGSLQTNPFPDATDKFFATMESATHQALTDEIKVWRPFMNMHKTDVVLLGKRLPLKFSQSCLKPQLDSKSIDILHCGQCNKCEERQQGFAQAGLEDPTPYCALAFAGTH